VFYVFILGRRFQCYVLPSFVDLTIIPVPFPLSGSIYSLALILGINCFLSTPQIISLSSLALLYPVIMTDRSTCPCPFEQLYSTVHSKFRKRLPATGSCSFPKPNHRSARHPLRRRLQWRLLPPPIPLHPIAQH
jgi:hypothetical protein